MTPVERCRQQIDLSRSLAHTQPTWYFALWEADYQAEHFILTGQLYEPPIDWKGQAA